MSLRMLSRQFISFQGMLDKRMPTVVHLRSVDKNEAQKLIEAVHEGVCGVHMNRTILAKKIKRILAKTLENYKDWADYLQFMLWGYRTTARTSTGVTPYSLVYGCEAVLPVEVEIRSLRVLLESKIPKYQWVESRLAQLTLLDEKRVKAMYHSQLYQKRIA